MTPTPSPTVTPTPSYDYVVKEFHGIPQPGNRDVAHIRGRLIDQNGQLVKGAHFEIASDGVPTWSATGPLGDSDGTVDFVVTKGRFAVRVFGGRSQYAGWMVTGQSGVGTMSDWEFTFQTTSPSVQNVPYAPTPTFTPTAGPAQAAPVGEPISTPVAIPTTSRQPVPTSTRVAGATPSPRGVVR